MPFAPLPPSNKSVETLKCKLPIWLRWSKGRWKFKVPQGPIKLSPHLHWGWEIPWTAYPFYRLFYSISLLLELMYAKHSKLSIATQIRKIIFINVGHYSFLQFSFKNLWNHQCYTCRSIAFSNISIFFYKHRCYICQFQPI